MKGFVLVLDSDVIKHTLDVTPKVQRGRESK